MSFRPRPRAVALLISLAMLLVACAPSPRSDGAGSAGVTQPATTEAPRAPKILTIGSQRAPTDLHRDLGERETGVGGASAIFMLPHDYLVVEDDSGAWIPRLAAEQISVDQGTWKVNADGSMDTIWKLRPNVKWHDGHPFTSDDLLFSFQVYKDPEVVTGGGNPWPLMESATAPDPLTFTIHWSSPHPEADRAQGLIPMPRHLIEDLYKADKTTIHQSPRFTTDFVGLGPYRLDRWELGSRLEFSRFDDYYLGRPPLDRVVIQLIGDPNTLLANIMAGAVDAINADGIDLEASSDLRQRWESTGNQVMILPAAASGGLRHLELQYRPQIAQPKNGIPNRQVREGLYRAIDRQRLTDVITQGRGPIADSWVPPYHALRKELESAVPQYPLDPARSQQLLAQAGWSKGGDGILVHQSYERFEIQLFSSQGVNVERAVAIIADDWKALGVQVNLHTIPINLGANIEYRSQLTGAGLNGGIGFDRYTAGWLHSKNITSPANRWANTNRMGYVNPKADAILDQLAVAIDPQRRVALHRDLIAETFGDLALMPLYWDIRVVPALKGVKNFDKTEWDLFHWDKE